MKKLFVLGIGVLFLTACGGETEEVTCTVDGKEAIFTLKEGMVYSYSLGGNKIKSSEIDEINGEYFTSATNNEEGKEALNTYINSVGGSCN